MLSLEPGERPRESCKYSTWSLPFSLCCQTYSRSSHTACPPSILPLSGHLPLQTKRNHRLRQPQQYKMVSEPNAPALPTTCRANCALYHCAVLLRFRNRCSSHSCPWTFSSSIHYRWAWCLCLCGRVLRNTTAIVPCTQSFRTLVELVCTFKCSLDFQALIFVFPSCLRRQSKAHTRLPWCYAGLFVERRVGGHAGVATWEIAWWL